MSGSHRSRTKLVEPITPSTLHSGELCARFTLESENDSFSGIHNFCSSSWEVGNGIDMPNNLIEVVSDLRITPLSASGTGARSKALQITSQRRPSFCGDFLSPDEVKMRGRFYVEYSGEKVHPGERLMNKNLPQNPNEKEGRGLWLPQLCNAPVAQDYYESFFGRTHTCRDRLKGGL